jgi:hypothetical protein
MLLNTIKIPKNLHYLTDRLPKPTYLKKTNIRLDNSEEHDDSLSKRDSTFLPTISKKRSQGRLQAERAERAERQGRSIEVRRADRDVSVISRRYDEEEEPRSNLSKHSSVKHSNYTLVLLFP